MSQIWSPSNPTGKYAGDGTNTEGEKNWGYQWLQVKDPGNSYRSYDIWFKQMSYMRINSIRLGYNIPEEIMRKIGFAAARIVLNLGILLFLEEVTKVISIRKLMEVFMLSLWQKHSLVV